jgi:hypothetical protein
MPLHLLGIARSGDIASLPIDWPDGHLPIVWCRPVETISGPCCSGIQWVVDGPLAAATVRPLPETFEPLEQAAWLAAIHAHIGILPVRYGTVLPDEEAIRDFLSKRRNNLLRDLVRVEGAGEVGLRIDLAESVRAPYSQNENDKHPPTSLPGQYLALRRKRYETKDRLDRQAQLASEDFVQALHGLYRDWRTLTSTVPTIVRLAFLVQRDFWKAFRQRLETKIPEQISRRCTLLGPWPPYSFT